MQNSAKNIRNSNTPLHFPERADQDGLPGNPKTRGLRVLRGHHRVDVRGRFLGRELPDARGEREADSGDSFFVVLL